jgi:hypothetical protein
VPRPCRDPQTMTQHVMRRNARTSWRAPFLVLAAIFAVIGTFLFPVVRADDDRTSKSEHIPGPKAENQIQNPGSAEQTVIYQTQWHRLQAVASPPAPPTPISAPSPCPAPVPNSLTSGGDLGMSSSSATVSPSRTVQKSLPPPHVEKPELTPKPASHPIDTGVRQVSATVVQTIPLECYGEAIFTEEETTEPPKRDPVLFALEESIRRRISVRCGRRQSEVEVTAQGDRCIRIRVSAHSPGEGKGLATKILQTPELEPFQILLDVAIVH